MRAERESGVEIWDRHWSEGGYDLQENSVILGVILEVMEGSVKGKRVLEVGSGRGCDIAWLAEIGAESFAIDFSEEALNVTTAVATEKGVEVVSFQADARLLPFPDGFFDLVFSQGLIEHWEPPDRLLKEQVRVVRRGGYVLVETPQLISVQAPLKRILMARDRWSFGWERDFTEGQLKRLMGKFGLEIVTAYGWGYLPPIKLGTGRVGRCIRELMRKAGGEKILAQGLTPGASVTRSQKSWLGRHCLNNIGLVGQKV